MGKLVRKTRLCREDNRQYRTYAEADGLFITVYDARRRRVGLVR